MSAEDVKDLYYDGVVLIFSLATKEEDVVHVYDMTPSSMSPR